MPQVAIQARTRGGEEDHAERNIAAINEKASKA